MRAAWTAALCLAAALAAAGARADETRPPATAQAAAPAREAQVRVRATHRVDVIAPGESVETVLDRMRATRSSTSAGEGRSGAGAPALPVRSPDGRAPKDRTTEPTGGAMPAGGSVTGGGLPTGMPRGEGLPPDRPHR